MEVQELTKQFPHLETERLYLRQLSSSDAKDVFEIFSDEEVTKYYDLTTFTSIERAERFINRMNEKFATNEGIRWAIALKSTNRLIGTCGYNAVYSSNRHRRAIIGYELKREHWRQGYMSEALHATSEYGFGDLQLNRLEALVLPGNERSFQVLSKLGFVAEGILREYGFWENKFWDMRCFSLLKREWQSR
jgi:ribosomal-protein-alanine N-acetyltransferase